MVENIEELCPELDVESFPDFGVLDQREIKRARAWTDELIATTVSESARSGRNKTVQIDVVQAIARVIWIGTRRRIHAVGEIERVCIFKP